MENAADALKMAAAILIFIIAIASSFSLFGTAKQTADSVIGMRDKQKYLDAAELDTVLYVSSDVISKEDSKTGNSQVVGLTTKGDRIVGIDDVISTIYRYNKEKYGVTIVDEDGKVIARFDSNTESVMSQYHNIESGFDKYVSELEKNTATSYVGRHEGRPDFSNLQELYAISVAENSKIRYGAPWYGNDNQIQKRVSADIDGTEYKFNGQTYQGKGIYDKIKNSQKIIEVINEIDQSQYLKDGTNETELLQQYKMPTVEVIYIVY